MEVFTGASGVAIDVYFVIQKRSFADWAATADWTPATGDCKIAKDGASVVNTTNLPTAIAGTGSTLWKLTLTATECTATLNAIQIVDAATKAVEDAAFMVQYDPPANVTKWAGTAVATPDTAGQPKVTVAAGTGTGQISLSSGKVSLVAADITTIGTTVWDQATSGHVTAATFGAQLKTVLDAVKAKTDNLPASPAAVGDIISAATMAAAVWDLATAGHVTAATFGAQLKTIVDAIKAKTDNLPASPAAVGDIIAATTIAAAVWDLATAGHVTAATFGAQVKTVVDAINAKTTNLPASPAAVSDIPTAAVNAAAVWDLATAGHVTAGTFGAQTKTLMDSINAKTTNLPASPAAVSDIPTLAAIVAGVWNEAQAGHTTAGTFGKFLDSQVSLISGGGGGPSAATIAAAVWDQTTAGHTTAATFGAQAVTLLNLIASYIDTEVASILAAVDTEVAAIKAKTDNLPALPAARGDVPTVADIVAALGPPPHGLVVASGPNTIQLQPSTPAGDHTGEIVMIVSGPGDGEALPLDSWNDTTKAGTVAANWVNTPVAGISIYVLLKGS